MLFFGSDRFDNSGDAQQGFWFFQNSIGLGTNSVGGGSGFTGVHKDGDVLVISDFSNGGTTSTITVYAWDATCKKTTGSTVGTCGDANLRIKGTSTTANCATRIRERPVLRHRQPGHEHDAVAVHRQERQRPTTGL